MYARFFCRPALPDLSFIPAVVGVWNFSWHDHGIMEGSGERGGGGLLVSCTPVVRRTVDPRGPTMAGRSASGFERPGAKREARREVFGEWHEG